MQFSRRALLSGFVALALPSESGKAQDEALKIIFPYSAGGSTDGVVRLLADNLQKSLGRAVIVVNRGGAGGRIGALAAKEAPPDGATLLFASGAQMVLQPHIYPDLGYDPFVDFVPISQVMRFDQALAVSSQVPVKSIAELIVWVKSNPAEAAFGSPGAGTGAHFAGVAFGRAAGLDLHHVPYRGTPAAIPDLLAGRIPMYLASTAELIEYQRSGGIRLLATLDAKRSQFSPSVPTLQECGIDLTATSWFAIYAPAGTSRAVAERFEKAIVAAVGAAEFRAKLLTMGFQPTGTTADELLRTQHADHERWGAIVKASGYKVER